MTILLQGWQHYPLQVPIKRPQLALPFVHSKIISHEGETENCTAGNKKKKNHWRLRQKSARAQVTTSSSAAPTFC